MSCYWTRGHVTGHVPGPLHRACRSSWKNPLPIGNNKIAGTALIKGNSIPTFTPIASCVPTPAPALPFASVMLVVKYTNADLQKATKLALKSFVQGQ